MTDEQTPQAEYVTPRQAWNEGWDACMEYVNGPDWGTASQNPYPKYAPTPQTPDDVREAVAVAAEQAYPDPEIPAMWEDVECNRAAFITGYTAALSAIPNPRVSAGVQRVLDAWNDEGPMPAYHRRAQNSLEQTWPTLFGALVLLTAESKNAANVEVES